MNLYERISKDMQRVIDNLDDFKGKMLTSQSEMATKQAQLTERLAATIQTTERLDEGLTSLSKTWDNKHTETFNALGGRIDVLDTRTEGLPTMSRLVWTIFLVLSTGVVSLVVALATGKIHF